MPDLRWNQEIWDAYDWRAGGEEWSGPWGSSTAQWFTTVLPRLGGVLPARRVLEIGPGFGRFTRFLVPLAGSYVGVDLSGRCVAACAERFADHPQATFFQNDGRSLECVVEQRFDLVFSYDTLVHAEYEVMGAYLSQLVPLLGSSGVAFIHHSNMGALPQAQSRANRAATVSAEVVEQLVRLSGGRVLIQETVAWEPETLSDCYTTFCSASGHPELQTLYLADAQAFERETRSARERFQHYLMLGGPPAPTESR